MQRIPTHAVHSALLPCVSGCAYRSLLTFRPQEPASGDDFMDWSLRHADGSLNLGLVLLLLLAGACAATAASLAASWLQLRASMAACVPDALCPVFMRSDSEDWDSNGNRYGALTAGPPKFGLEGPYAPFGGKLGGQQPPAGFASGKDEECGRVLIVAPVQQHAAQFAVHGAVPAIEVAARHADPAAQNVDIAYIVLADAPESGDKA